MQLCRRQSRDTLPASINNKRAATGAVLPDSFGAHCRRLEFWITCLEADAKIIEVSHVLDSLPYSTDFCDTSRLRFRAAANGVQVSGVA